MEISENLLCLYSATVDERNGSYVIDVPKNELTRGRLQRGDVYRVALLPTDDTGTAQPNEVERDIPEPPVEEGETRVVEIEDIGEQGDGIARVERGYVIIVPKTDIGDRVTIEITTVRENVAFADVVTADPLT